MPCSFIDTYNFAPPAPQDQTIGSNSSTEPWAPQYKFYDYGYFAYLYTSAEMGGAKTISKIAFNMINTSGSTYTSNNQTLTFYHANESVLPSSLRNNMTSATSGTWTISDATTTKSNFSWTITSVDDWYEIELDTPFVYNGTDNLLIRWFNNDGSYIGGTSSNPKSFGNNTGDFRAYYDYQDGSAPSLTSFGTRDSTFRPQIRITYT